MYVCCSIHEVNIRNSGILFIYFYLFIFYLFLPQLIWKNLQNFNGGPIYGPIFIGQRLHTIFLSIISNVNLNLLLP